MLLESSLEHPPFTQRLPCFYPTTSPIHIHFFVGTWQLFNTRTMQLVLGAGAIQAAAKLRSITAKHLGEMGMRGADPVCCGNAQYADATSGSSLPLTHTHTQPYTLWPVTALASQSLTLITVLLPHVRAALATQLHTKQQAFLTELDRIEHVRSVWDGCVVSTFMRKVRRVQVHGPAFADHTTHIIACRSTASTTRRSSPSWWP